jgi:hypothetical protein
MALHPLYGFQHLVHREDLVYILISQEQGHAHSSYQALAIE